MTVRKATHHEWDTIVDQCDLATYFHTRGWAEMRASYSNGKLRPAALLATFTDGTRAVLPANEKTILDLPVVGRLSSQLTTTISCDGLGYGGWVSPTQLTERHHELLWKHVENRSIAVHQNPFDPAMALLPWTEKEFTQVVDLRRPPDQLTRGWSRGHVSAANKARRAGLTVSVATTTREWQEYVEIYTGSFERWGDPEDTLDERTFALLSRSDPEKVKLWLVRSDDRILSGAVCLYHRRIAMYWSGAFRKEFQKLRPAPFMHAEIMRDAIASGIWWYDFNPSGGIDGVVTFKQRFGAERLPANSLISNGPVKRRLASLKSVVPRI